MRVSVAWLRSCCDPELSTHELADRLALSGTEVERVERIGVGATDAFVVGRVEAVEAHPNADRLRVCAVDDGTASGRTIVCGAPNVATGQTVAVARPGAVMPDGSTLAEAKLRGVVSSGMILAEDEVGVGEGHAGTMVLDGGAEPGEPLIDHLQIADEALELEVSPNRPDCLGVFGVARELHALTGAPLAEDPTAGDAEPAGTDHAGDHAAVEIADPDICLRFTARVFEQVEVGPSPLWLKQRLLAAGQRPISNVVDITNYVMLLCGQPLHAFDLDAVRGARIVVRRAREGEAMTTLDGVERRFDTETALVCDAEGPSGIAGIMGGSVSEVSEQTTRVLMEAATWVGSNVLRSSGRLGLRTEASTRFEKQLHPDQALAAQRLAARLMVELCGARLVPGTLDEYPHPAQPRTVELRHDRVERLLGEAIPRERVELILARLGFDVATEDGRLSASVPAWRDADVQREADLIEEVARVAGLERLPTTLPARRRAVGRLTREQRLRRRLEDAARDRGLHEVVAFSFTAPAMLERLRLGDREALRLANPLSEDHSVMRPLLLGGLLDAAARNAARDHGDVALFESARVYRPRPAVDGGRAPALERHHLAGLLTGSLPGSWRSPRRRADFYAARAIVEGLLEVAAVDWTAEPSEERPYLHPARAAKVAAGRELGFVGELHPGVAADWGLESAAAFELDLDAVCEAAPGEPAGYRELTAFPPLRRDIAVVVDEQLAAAAVEAAIRQGAGELLAELELFDVYRGDQVGPGRKSLALRLEFSADDRTLTDADVAQASDAIGARLADLGGSLRG